MPETVTQNETIMEQISSELNISLPVIRNVIELLEEGNTVPFIARYRKEQTKGADDVQVHSIQEAWQYKQQLEERKGEVLRLIDEQGKLTDELRQNIEGAAKLQAVEDLYRPYRQKRRTRATKAKEKGLEPLATWVYSQPRDGDVEAEAKSYISEEDDLATIEDVIQGVNDIMAEWIADDPEVRQTIRERTFQIGTMRSAAKDTSKDEQSIYEMYYEYDEAVKKVPSHRILAMNRGEKEGVLKVSIEAPEERFIDQLEKMIIKRFGSPALAYIQAAIQDAYKRLIAPAVERDIRKQLSEQAEEQAIHIFSENLKNLLLQPPIRGKIVLGVDPAYRTGCKLAVVDDTGKLLDIQVIYPTPPKKEIEKSKEVIQDLVKKHGIEVITIGNGTASRETEQFISDIIPELPGDISYLIINEAGASVYSASTLARKEFPDLEVEERSAVSIARRLQDPLAELVKIDPKSVGVGQYQHDVTQSKLNESLRFVVETAVNQVGVNVNTASSSLLQYVSGLSKTVANNIVKRREEEGKFINRKELKKVPRLGAKTYEQAIGFMRIIDGENPLDKTAIHPESYDATEKLLTKLDESVRGVGSSRLKEKLDNLNLNEIAKELNVGVPTLSDIVEDLKRPNRDPRDEWPKPVLKTGVMDLEDLEKGMELQGTVRNVVDFGAFVDIGVKQDGLVHISKLANRFVKHPMEVVAVGDVVTVWVEDKDVEKGRISLTMLPPSNQID